MPFRVVDSDSGKELLSCNKVQTLIDYIDRNEEEWNVKMMDITSNEDGT
jgi:hypothetical protein